MSNPVPSSLAVVLTLAGVTWRRLLRGRAVWVCVGIALLPTAMGAAVQGRHTITPFVAGVELIVMSLLSSVFVASSIGEEIEDRTTTYLWSRPIPRWTVLAGKLLALAPIAAVLIAGGWVVAIHFGTSKAPSLQSTLAFAAGGLATAAAAAGIATLVPKHGMALSIVYLVILDLIIGAIPASLQSISITRQVVLLGGIDTSVPVGEPAITLAVIAAAWLAIGFSRMRRLES